MGSTETGNRDAIKGQNTFETFAGQAGVRATVDTGPVNHALSVNYSNIERPGTAPTYAIPAGAFIFSNLYKPANVPVPTFTTFSNTLSETNLSSVGVADTMSILNDRIQFTAGARRQTAGTSSTNALTGAGTTYEASVWSPAYAVLVRPLENVSVYANYIEGLQAGVVVPSNFANRGEVLPPYQTKQMEAGIKVDFGRISTTVAAFEITRPSLITVGVAPNNSQVPDGEQRNRGVELNVFGELTPTVRVLGGVALIDGRLVKTQGGANDGRKAQGVADVNINLGAEWDLPFIAGLTVTGRMIHTGAAFINAANTQSIPAWTRVDLGARYTFVSPWNAKPIVVRFTVENVANESYWSGSYTADGIVTLGNPRTYLASTTFNF